MIKEDIVRDLASKQKINQMEARKIVEEIIATVKKSLQEKDRVLISGFGSFKVNEKKERLGRNPQTKEEHQISQRNVVNFRPSKNLKKFLNE